MPITRFSRLDIKSKFGNTIANTLAGDATVTITDAGIVAVQSFLVTDVVAKADAVLITACYAPRVPRHGSEHPSIPGIWVTRVASKLIEDTPDGAEVVVTWGTPASTGATGFFDNVPDGAAIATLEVSTTLQTVQTNLDVNGKPIFVDFNPGIDTDGDGIPDASSAEVVRQGATVEIQIPMTTRAYRRSETIQTLMDGELLDFEDKAEKFTGTVNKKSIFKGGISTWLCSRIHGISDDGEQTVNATYEFIKAPQRLLGADGKPIEETWGATIRYIAPDTGRPPAFATLGNGIKDGIKVYRPADFSLLQLGARR